MGLGGKEEAEVGSDGNYLSAIDYTTGKSLGDILITAMAGEAVACCHGRWSAVRRRWRRQSGRARRRYRKTYLEHPHRRRHQSAANVHARWPPVRYRRHWRQSLVIHAVLSGDFESGVRVRRGDNRNVLSYHGRARRRRSDMHRRMTYRKMRFALAVLVTSVVVIPGVFAQPPPRPPSCETAPTLFSVTANMSLEQVQEKLGAGVLNHRAANRADEWQYYYGWRRRSATIEGIFDPAKKLVIVTVSSPSQIDSVWGVILNQDTIGAVQRRLRRANAVKGPTFGEGNYAFYSLVYGCRNDVDVEFMTELEL